MKKNIQDKINGLKKLAQTSGVTPSPKRKESSAVGDSLSKTITNQKDATMFLAELEAAIRMAQAK